MIALDPHAAAILDSLEGLEPQVQTGILVGCILVCIDRADGTDFPLDAVAKSLAVNATAQNLIDGWEKLSAMKSHQELST